MRVIWQLVVRLASLRPMRNRRFDNEPDVPADGPSFRLRYVLLVALTGLLVASGYPRAKAAWKLHDQASALANYGLCMVGPTGPNVIRDGGDEFRHLLRRRLLSAEAEDQPFAACRPLYEQYFETKGDVMETAASGFREYGSPAPVSNASLEPLVPDVARLAELSARAWPFHRKPFLELVRSSTHAKEAPHPVDFPMPVLGSGLHGGTALYRTAWADGGRLWLAMGHGVNLALFESADGGQTWQRTALSAPGIAEHAGRCTGNDGQQSFTFEQEEGKLTVVSLMGDDPVGKTTLRIKAAPRSSSCDLATAVFIAEPDNEEESELAVLCQHGGRCGRLQVPATWISDGFDVAQVKEVTVLASVAGGVVRVRSSRDHGKTWTPATVALDAQSAGIPLADAKQVHLQPVGERLLLWVTGDGAQRSYPLVVSEDFGASFRGAELRAVPTRGISRAAAPRASAMPGSVSLRSN